MSTPQAPESSTALDAVVAERERRRQARAAKPIRCPHCRRKGIEVAVGQYTWNTQDFVADPNDPDGDDWGTSEYSYEGDVLIDARCRACDGDLTLYLLRRGWEFKHDVTIPNRQHERPPIKQRPALVSLLRHSSAAELDAEIEEATDRLGRLLDERARRRA